MMSVYPQIKADNVKCGTDVKIAPTAEIVANVVVIEDKAEIHDGVRLTGDKIQIGKFSIIEQNNCFNVRQLEIGYKVKIERGGSFRAINGAAEKIIFGDFSFVAFNQDVITPELTIGDYTALHNSLLINGYKPCKLGHNCWVGQNTILNCTERLTIGNNVRIGTQSQLWTHVASGELLEGCTLFGAHPLTIEDNVWIVGGAVISPNLTLRNGSVIMVGSVLTKSTEPKHTYAGVPARDVSNKISSYREVNLDEKYQMMAEFIKEFHLNTDNKYSNQIILVESLDQASNQSESKECLIITKRGKARDIGLNISVFSLEEKEYTKKRTGLEEEFIRFNLGYRARFVPV